MNLNTVSHQRVTLVKLPERLVMSNADEAREALMRLVNDGQDHLVLDLSAVSFVDSSGLAVLIATYKALDSRNGKMVLAHPNDNVRALIELTRLHELFTIYEDGEAAIDDLQVA